MAKVTGIGGVFFKARDSNSLRHWYRTHLGFDVQDGGGAQFLFNRRDRFEIDQCAGCGGQLKILASIEEPAVMAKILAHLERSASEPYQPELPLAARAPPAQSNLL